MQKFVKDFQKSPPLERFVTLAIILSILWYVLLCLLHYFSQRPLWLDEQSVYVNLKSLAPLDFFFQPLLVYQVFPRVYLFLIQQFSSFFDFHLLSVRLPSLICMMLAFSLWLKIVSYEFKRKIEFLSFVMCWPASAVLLYYAAELKPYSMDVLTGSLFVLFLYHQQRLEASGKDSKYALILVALPITVLFSYPAFLFAFLPLYNLLLSVKEDRSKTRFLLPYAVSFLFFGLISYFFDIRLRPAETLTAGWGALSYFVSTESIGAFFQSFGEGTLNLFFRWFIEDPRILKKWGIFFITWGMLRMFYGFFLNIKKDSFRLKSVDTIALVIFAELFILGVLKKYPFTVVRTSLFFCPIALVLMVKGIAVLKKFTFLRGFEILIYRIITGGLMFYLIFLSICFFFFVSTGTMSYSPMLW